MPQSSFEFMPSSAWLSAALASKTSVKSWRRVKGSRIYPDDFPYPSALVLGWVSGRALHLIFAAAPEARIVITVYEPDLNRWEPDYRKRKL